MSLLSWNQDNFYNYINVSPYISYSQGVSVLVTLKAIDIGATLERGHHKYSWFVKASTNRVKWCIYDSLDIL